LYSAITTTNATDNATANATDNATNNATAKATTKATAKSAGALSCEQVDVCLSAIDDNLVSFTIDGQCHRRTLELRGIYNAYNAAAALALVRQILPDGNSAARTQQLLDVLSKIKSAFGRGETFVINETKVELLLVKNPGGFRLALESFSHSGVINMIAINDDYADGRDMSWLFDVPFDALRQYGVQMLSGVRAWDMALRLDYDDVFVAAIQQDLASALTKFLQIEPASTHRIYCTYTAMLLIRKLLGNLTLVEKVM
jgi:UDP-N-acetylmuramyl tripeptide synthase